MLAQRHWILALLTFVGVTLTAAPVHAQGYILSGAGPVNRSMGGASTAAPLDATGALYWNPASISGLPSSQLDFGLELLYPRLSVESAIPAGALGPGLPGGPLAGKTRGDAGAFALPTAGFVFKPEGSLWTFGLGVFPVGGFGTNYPGSTTNPLFGPTPPNGFGFGPVVSELQMLQLAPVVAYQICDRLSIGFGPTVGISRLTVTPGLFAAPDDANGDGFAQYPDALHSRYHWGLGVQAGVYWTVSDAWRLGASFKSPMWFERYEYQSADEIDQPRTLTLQFNSPLIVSVGTAYTGIDRLTLALDVRYINFAENRFLSRTGFAPNGAVRGLGWSDAVAVALGAQYELTDCLTLRAGYTYNTNPVPDEYTMFNVPAATIYEHQIAAGASIKLSPACSLSLAYVHYFENSITGGYLTPAGAIPGASVRTSLVADSLILGFSGKF